MDKNSIVFVGLNTHKEFTEVVYCLDQRGSDFHQVKLWRYYPVVKAIHVDLTPEHSIDYRLYPVLVKY